jgi:hypothetical protein
MKPKANLVLDPLHQVLNCLDNIQQSKDNLEIGGDPLYCLLGIMDWVTELARVLEEIEDIERSAVYYYIEVDVSNNVEN